MLAALWNKAFQQFSQRVSKHQTFPYCLVFRIDVPISGNKFVRFSMLTETMVVGISHMYVVTELSHTHTHTCTCTLGI